MYQNPQFLGDAWIAPSYGYFNWMFLQEINVDCGKKRPLKESMQLTLNGHKGEALH